MADTITPAGCGGRARQISGLALFAAAAIAAAALVGAALGLAGSLLPRLPVLGLVGAFALAAALREAGLLRLPLPQRRRQVPERWRRDLPLPLWTAGYGAGLGAGVLTHQPVATFWLACAGALALGDPRAAAAAFALYGAARGLTAAAPSGEAFVARRRLLRPLNAGGIAACLVLLCGSAAHAAVLPLGAGAQLDPATTTGALAYTQRGGGRNSVVVRPDGAPAITIPGAREPSLDGPLLAYADATGVRVVRFSTGETLAVLHGVDEPALAYPWLAFRLRRGGLVRLFVRNLQTFEQRELVRASGATTIGRPAIDGDTVAWSTVRRSGSRIVAYSLARRASRVVARSGVLALHDPALDGSRIAWIGDAADGSSVWLSTATGRAARTLGEPTAGRVRLYGTALVGRALYVTRWAPGRPARLALRRL